MEIITRMSIIAVVFVSTTPISAGEFFVGVTGGQSNFSGLNEGCDRLIRDNQVSGRFAVGCRVTEDADTVLGVNAGYNFNQFVGLEAGYWDLGEYQVSISSARIIRPVTVELNAAYAGLVLTAPIGNSFSLSARLGAVNANGSGLAIGTNLSTDDETSGFLGASFDYRFTDKFSFQIRYDNLDVLDITSAGIRFYF